MPRDPPSTTSNQRRELHQAVPAYRPPSQVIIRRHDRSDLGCTNSESRVTVHDKTLFELAIWRLEEQLSELDKLDRRLTATFTAATALLVLFATFGDLNGSPDSSTTALVVIFSGTAPSERDIEIPVLILLVVGGLGYVTLLVAILQGMRFRPLVLGADLERLARRSRFWDDSELRSQAATDILDALSRNELQVRRKALWTSLAITLWALEVLVLALAAFWSVF